MFVLAEYFVEGAAPDPAPDAAVAGTNLEAAEAAGATEAAEAPAPAPSAAAAGMPAAARPSKRSNRQISGDDRAWRPSKQIRSDRALEQGGSYSVGNLNCQASH
jgi:hypothetical protein